MGARLYRFPAAHGRVSTLLESGRRVARPGGCLGATRRHLCRRSLRHDTVLIRGATHRHNCAGDVPTGRRVAVLSCVACRRCPSRYPARVELRVGVDPADARLGSRVGTRGGPTIMEVEPGRIGPDWVEGDSGQASEVSGGSVVGPPGGGQSSTGTGPEMPTSGASRSSLSRQDRTT